MCRKYCLLALMVFLFLAVTPTIHALWDQNNEAIQLSEKATTLIVKFKSGVRLNRQLDKSGIVQTNIPQLNTLNQKYGVTEQQKALPETAIRTDDNPLKNVYLLYPANNTNIESMAHEMTALDIVEYAQPNYPLELFDIPNDTFFTNQWALNNTGQPYYYVYRREGEYNDTLIDTTGTPDADIDALETMENPPDHTNTVIVAIIDTGVDKDHPDLAGNMWTNPGEIPDNGLDDDHNGYIDDIYGWNFIAADPGKGNNQPVDDFGHGTHCAGIVNAMTNNGIGIAGVTPEAKIMAVKILTDFSSLLAALGIIYAADNGADVINMSWGSVWQMPIIEEALDYARARGVILIASAGNFGDDRHAYPASYASTISVSASNSDDHITVWSSYDDDVTLCAPGESILSLRAANTDMYARSYEPNVHIIDTNYYLASGTSMSGPHVVAVAGYMRAVSPGLTPDAAQLILQLTADDIIDPYGTGASMPGWDQYSGYGRVNLTAALAATPNTRAIITSPQRFSIVSGATDIYGSADGTDFVSYILEYGFGDDPTAFTQLVNTSAPVTDGLLGTMPFDSAGIYTVRLRVNETNMARIRLYVTDQPEAQIQTPSDGQTVGGWVNIVGTAVCPDFDHSLVEYGLGTEPTSWTQISNNSIPIFDDDLASWNTISLLTGDYSLRLSVYSTSGLEMADTITVTIGSVFTPPDGWKTELSGTLSPFANYADVNQDGVNEILIGSSIAMYFLDLDGNVLTTGVPELPPDDYRTPAAVGKLDNDNFDDFVIIGAGGMMYVFPSQTPPFTVALTETPDSWGYFIPGNENDIPKVFLKDINGDGIDEIHYFPGNLTSSRSGYHFIYNADGSEWACGFPPPNVYKKGFPADLDGDGIDEIYCYGTELAQFDTCGQFVRSVPVEWNGLLMYVEHMEMTAADIDRDGKLELIVSGFFADPPVITYDYQIFAYDDGLILKDGWPRDLGIDARLLAPGSPIFGDLDGDSTLEYIMLHNDLEFGYIHAWHIDGVPFSGDTSSADGMFAITPERACLAAPLMVDCDADGLTDITVTSGGGLYMAPMVERIMAFNQYAAYDDGYPLVVSNQYKESKMHCPAFGDINKDGKLDVVYPSDQREVVFANFPDVTYNPNNNFCPMWRYNRRLNATRYFFVPGLCGDINDDGNINIFDITYLISYLYLSGPAPHSPDMADVNHDGNLNIFDITYLITYLYLSGPPPDCP
jgi:hypothetical protein